MKAADMNVPHLFLCPISLELFRDPVTLSTGQTYERANVEKWLAAGNRICPVTMQELQDSSMVPNHALRHLIDEWLHFHAVEESDGSIELSENDAFKQVLESDESTFEDKLRVLEQVHSLSQQLPLNNSCLIIMDFFALLLELAFGKTSLKLSEEALVCALILMPFSDMGALNMLKQEAKYANFLYLFVKGSILMKKSLCHLVEVISCNSDTQELCRKLGESPLLLQEIVGLIDHELEHVEVGIRAVSALSSVEQNRKGLVKAGASEGLIAYLSKVETQKRSSSAALAMEALENLLSVRDAREAVINHSRGIRAVVKMVFRVSSDHEGSESAVNSLLLICSDSKIAREKAVLDGLLTQLLLLLQSQCSGRAKTQARMLLRLLRIMWKEEVHPIHT